MELAQRLHVCPESLAFANRLPPKSDGTSYLFSHFFSNVTGWYLSNTVVAKVAAT